MPRRGTARNEKRETRNRFACYPDKIMKEPEPLWKAAGQADRLAELIAHDPQRKEAPLRRDVRSLGILLGRVLKEQGGEELFDTVEKLRELLIQQRERSLDARGASGSELMREAQGIVSQLSVAD